MQTKTTSLKAKAAIGGYALTITIIMMGIMLLIFASIFSFVHTSATLTTRNNQYNMSQNAAESAVERVIGQIDRDFVSLAVGTASSYVSLPAGIDQGAWPIQYVFSTTNGSTGSVSVVIGNQSSTPVPLNSQFTGLQAYARQVDVYATATPLDQRYNVPATVHESLQLANIPLYQFAIFYNVNLEVMSSQGLNIWGPVFCNQSIWEGSTKATFYTNVTAVGSNYIGSDDPFCDYTGSGAAVFKMAGQPVNNANALVMPIGTNNSPGAVMSLLQLPPSDYAMGTAAAYSSNGIVYPANGADLVITNFASGTNEGPGVMPYGTNMLVYFQDSSLLQVPFDVYFMTNRISHTFTVSNAVAPAYYSNIYFATYSFVTNAVFYDWREGYNNGSGPPKRVESVDIDVAALNKWLTNSAAANSGYTDDQNKYSHSGHHIDSIYVYTSVALTGTQLPAVRVKNGAALPNPPTPAPTQPAGLTVATQFPLYVWGNYNCQDSSGSAVGLNGTNSAIAHTLPAALMGDAITILSPTWTDSGSLANNISSGGPTVSADATVNAAMLCGIVASDPTKTGNVGYNGDYSGGVENFLRLLEDWGNDTLTYNGSIVVLFYSQYGTNAWRQTGKYYSAPTRHWAFDLNFNNAMKLPPLTPQIKALVRGNWYAQGQ